MLKMEKILLMEYIQKVVNKYKGLSQLKKNILSGSVFSGVNIVIILISYPIYLHYLGVEKYGLWVTVSVILAFSQLGQMGIDVAITKYVANAYGKKNFDAITEYITTSFYILFIPSILIILVLSLFNQDIANFIKLKGILADEGTKLIFCVGILSVFSIFVNVVKGVIAGIDRMDVANYTFLFSRIIQLLCVVSLLVLGYGIWSLYFGFLLYYAFPFIYWSYVITKHRRITIFHYAAFRKHKFRELVKFGGTLTIGTIAHMFVVPFNKVIIARYVGFSEVTYYQIAFQVISSLRNIFVKGLEAILPKISELHGLGKKSLSNILAVHKKGMQFMLLLALPLFAAIFIFADQLLKIWLGQEFNHQITIVLRILLIGWCINALAVPDYFMFLGIGREKYSVTATCIKSITNIMLILGFLFLYDHVSLLKVTIIDSFSLVMAAIYLKYKYLGFKKLNGELL